MMARLLLQPAKSIVAWEMVVVTLIWDPPSLASDRCAFATARMPRRDRKEEDITLQWLPPQPQWMLMRAAKPESSNARLLAFLLLLLHSNTEEFEFEQSWVDLTTKRGVSMQTATTTHRESQEEPRELSNGILSNQFDSLGARCWLPIQTEAIMRKVKASRKKKGREEGGGDYFPGKK